MQGNMHIYTWTCRHLQRGRDEYKLIIAYETKRAASFLRPRLVRIHPFHPHSLYSVPYPCFMAIHTHTHTHTHLDTQIIVCGGAYTMPFDCRKVRVYSYPVCVRQCDQVYYTEIELGEKNSISHKSQHVLHKKKLVSCFLGNISEIVL